MECTRARSSSGDDSGMSVSTVPNPTEMRKWIVDYVQHVYQQEIGWLTEEKWTELVRACQEWHRKGWAAMCPGEILRYM